MKRLTLPVQSFWRAALAYFDAVVAIWYPPRDVAPFVSRLVATETMGYVYLCLLADLDWPVGWSGPAMDVDVLHTNLGNGEPLFLQGLAPDGSRIFAQRHSVVVLVLLAPGNTVPRRFEDRVTLAESLTRRGPFLVS